MGKHYHEFGEASEVIGAFNYLSDLYHNGIVSLSKFDLERDYDKLIYDDSKPVKSEFCDLTDSHNPFSSRFPEYQYNVYDKSCIDENGNIIMELSDHFDFSEEEFKATLYMIHNKNKLEVSYLEMDCADHLVVANRKTRTWIPLTDSFTLSDIYGLDKPFTKWKHPILTLCLWLGRIQVLRT